MRTFLKFEPDGTPPKIVHRVSILSGLEDERNYIGVDDRRSFTATKFGKQNHNLLRQTRLLRTVGLPTMHSVEVTYAGLRPIKHASSV